MSELTIPDALALVRQQIQAGRLAEAEAGCRAILAVSPEEAEAYRLCGLAAYCQGRLEAARELLQRSIGLQPYNAYAYDNLSLVLCGLKRLPEAEAAARQALSLHPAFAEAENNLGNVLRIQGRFEEAEAPLRQATALRPEFADAHCNLGLVLQTLQRHGEAEAEYRRAMALGPGDAAANAHNNLGTLLQERGQLEEAEAEYRAALRLNLGQIDALNNLATLLHMTGRFDQAEAAYRQMLRLRPAHGEAHGRLGALLHEQGRLGEAEEALRQAVALDPSLADAWCHLGIVLRDQDRAVEAEAAYRQALRLRPDFIEAAVNLGNALNEQLRLAEAAEAYRHALTLRPNHPQAHYNRGAMLQLEGRIEEAYEAYGRAVALQPDFLEAHDNALLAAQYLPDMTAPRLAELHAQWDRVHTAPLRTTWRPHGNSRDPGRPLRLGFLSPDLCCHPVGHFLLPVLEALAQRSVEIACYSAAHHEDPLAARFRAAAGTWRDVWNLSDEALAQQIRSDAIDILFDLSGHTAHSRLSVFGRKPAPIAITWIGYEGTTGMPAIDYILADERMIPPGTESHYCEKVLRLPETYVCYCPEPGAPHVGPLPAGQRGHVTFCSFNNPAKINARVVDCWARILARVPGSWLVLKYKAFSVDTVQRRFREMFVARGISGDRLGFFDWSSHLDVLNLYNRVDIALDPFPFGGAATTCDALWMGVPVVTLPGETFAGRHSLDYLTNVGLTETIARDPDHYVDLAAGLAADLPRLADLRAGLRPRMTISPLCSGPRLADHLLPLLRQAWRRWATQ